MVNSVVRTTSFGGNNTAAASSSSKRLDYSQSFNQPTREIENGTPTMLPIFLNDLRRNQAAAGGGDGRDLVEVTLEVGGDNSVVLYSVAPAASGGAAAATSSSASTSPTGGVIRDTGDQNVYLSRTASRVFKRTLSRLRSWGSRASSASSEAAAAAAAAVSAVDKRGEMKARAKLIRTTSSAQRALGGLRFISKTTTDDSETSELWKTVESRFDSLAKDGLLSREDFGECIGMADSKEFAVGVFDALARRWRQKVEKISKEELHEFWLQISDKSFDARLQIFFDMADSNDDGRITRDEVIELIMLSASANKLSTLKERVEEYADLIMEELDPDHLGYIELWQLEILLLQKDTYMNYSRPPSQASVGWSPSAAAATAHVRANTAVRRLNFLLKSLFLENWQRAWILLLWLAAVAGLFTWKFLQYRNRAAFQVMGYCYPTAKGAAETLKLNMAVILLPVCRNTLTWLRSTRARLFIPFDDNLNFHKIVAGAIAVGILLHAGNHLVCDFPHLIHSSPEKFGLIASDFNNVRPTYKSLLTGVVGSTGILMVVLMIISFTLATTMFRKNGVKLPFPFNKLTGFNAFWYSHHLLAIVYILLLIHGTLLFLVHGWEQKTTWMYISVPLLLYVAERSLRTCRSNQCAVKILKVSVLPGNVFSLIMSKPNGFKYKSGQYIFLQCPSISPFEWHPFSITSAPGDDYISVHIRIVGDWTRELKRIYTDQVDATSTRVIDIEPKCGKSQNIDENGLPRLLIDGPYGAPAQDYQNYDVLLLVGLGIGATPFISILRDLLNNTRTEDHGIPDSATETTGSDCTSLSMTSIASSSTASTVKKATDKASKSAHFYWVTREPGSFEWFKGVMQEVAEMDYKDQIEMHNYLTSVYEEGDARSTLITMIQALNHAKHGVDILSGTRVRTHFARPNWREVFQRIAMKHPYATVGVFYCGMPVLAKELKKLSHELTYKTSTRFEFHKEYF